MIYARCMSCSKVFRSRLSNFENFGGNVYISRNEEICPYCGGPARTDDISSYVHNGVRQIVRYRWINASILERMSEIRQAVANKEIDRKEAVAKAEELHPEAGGAMLELLNFKVNLAMLILNAAMLYFTMHSDSSSPSEVDDRLQEIIKRVLEDDDGSNGPTGYKIDPSQYGVYRQPGDDSLTWPHGTPSKSMKPKAGDKPAGSNTKGNTEKKNRKLRRAQEAKDPKAKRARRWRP